MSGSPKSMTGFAQSRIEENGWSLRISLRSVNHRFLDLHVRLPEGFEAYESPLRQRLREHLRRGHVDLNLFFEATGPAAVHVNREVAAAYLRAARDLQKEFGGQAELDLAAILRLPGVVGGAAPAVREDQERLGERILACLDEALSRLEQMRQAEGCALAEEMLARLKHVSASAAQLESMAQRVRPLYARRLEARLKELLAGTPPDPARIAQEAALLAERGDITEELTRLRSHVQQYEKLLAAPGEIGKKLDFLVQEMQREANTLLSKTPGVEEEGLAVTSLALEIKSEIEKLREQAQNIE